MPGIQDITFVEVQKIFQSIKLLVLSECFWNTIVWICENWLPSTRRNRKSAIFTFNCENVLLKKNDFWFALLLTGTLDQQFDASFWKHLVLFFHLKNYRIIYFIILIAIINLIYFSLFFPRLIVHDVPCYQKDLNLLPLKVLP